MLPIADRTSRHKPLPVPPIPLSLSSNCYTIRYRKAPFIKILCHIFPTYRLMRDWLVEADEYVYT